MPGPPCQMSSSLDLPGSDEAWKAPTTHRMEIRSERRKGNWKKPMPRRPKEMGRRGIGKNRGSKGDPSVVRATAAALEPDLERLAGHVLPGLLLVVVQEGHGLIHALLAHVG